MANILIINNHKIFDLKADFKKRILYWSNKTHAIPVRVRFQKMSRKWGSCSTAGQITFNITLFDKPRYFQDAVIVHELLHLLVPNHGKLFKSMFSSFLPKGEEILNKGTEKVQARNCG